MHHYLQFNDLHYTYDKKAMILRGISFRISHGEHVALAGANGAGKSTLLMHTNGLLYPTQGSVDVGGVLLTEKTEQTIRQRVGMVFQESRLMDWLNVSENITFHNVSKKSKENNKNLMNITIVIKYVEKNKNRILILSFCA